MFVRVLCLILLALNVGAAAWLLTGHPAHTPAPAASDPGIPELRLIHAAPSPAQVPPPTPHAGALASPAPAPSVASAATVQPAAADACFRLGPFAGSAAAGAALHALAPHVARIRERAEPGTGPTGYWVYLPPAASRAAALAVVKELVGKGVRSYYIVPAGAAQNAISLGLFDDRAHARQRVAALRELGFGARVAQRGGGALVYWLDYAIPAQGAFAWSVWLPDHGGLQSTAVSCA